MVMVKGQKQSTSKKRKNRGEGVTRWRCSWMGKRGEAAGLAGSSGEL
jgi:hypothetical protein